MKLNGPQAKIIQKQSWKSCERRPESAKNSPRQLEVWDAAARVARRHIGRRGLREPVFGFKVNVETKGRTGT